MALPPSLGADRSWQPQGYHRAPILDPARPGLLSMEDRSKARDPGPSTSTSWPLASGPSSWPTCFLGSKSKNGPQENCQFVAHFVHLPSQRVPHQCIPSIWGSGGVSSHLVLGFAAQPLPPPGHYWGGGLGSGPNWWLPWPPASCLPFARCCLTGLGLGRPSGLHG